MSYMKNLLSDLEHQAEATGDMRFVEGVGLVGEMPQWGGIKNLTNTNNLLTWLMR